MGTIRPANLKALVNIREHVYLILPVIGERAVGGSLRSDTVTRSSLIRYSIMHTDKVNTDRYELIVCPESTFERDKSVNCTTVRE